MTRENNINKYESTEHKVVEVHGLALKFEQNNGLYFSHSLASSDGFGSKGGDAQVENEYCCVRQGTETPGGPREAPTSGVFPQGDDYPRVSSAEWAGFVLGLIGCALLGLIFLHLLGCGGAERVTRVDAPVLVDTAYGTVTLSGSADPEDVARYIEDGYDRVTGQGFHLRATGLSIVMVERDDIHGQYHPGADVMEIATTAAIRHEVHHRACHQLHRPSECCRLQDHSPGYDLHCRRQG